MNRFRRSFVAWLTLMAASGSTLAGWPMLAGAYPLDGYEKTGIGRVEAQRLVQIGEKPGKKRPSGELLPLEMVDLRLLEHREMELPEPDPKLTARLKKLLGPEADRYGMTLLDLSDLENPRYAEWNGHQRQNPGSVGKIMVALAIFQALADIYPDDIAARENILRTSMITADIFSVSDHHSVPFWNPETGTVSKRPIKQGDTASLWTYLDWMMSPSSNSAAAMNEKTLVSITHFGKRYPVSPEEEQKFFDDTPKKQLSEIFLKAIQDPVTRNGMDIEQLRQGSFFTHQGKKQIPGTNSYATPRALANFMLKLEQGKLVDEWSSREIKRLMYITERRIRYGSSGVLRPSAVYFKSGSLYSCAPEEGFVCKKYHGNKRNYMNSVAIIETPAGQDRLFYSVAVLSNVLRKNSAQDHRDLARAVHSMLIGDHPPKPVPAGARAPETSYGIGFIGYEEERREKMLKFEIQEALLALGYEIGEIDGIIGRGTRGAIRSFQKAQGDPADGKPSAALLDKMRKVAQSRGLSRPAPAP
ncbi:MAG: peptidoglycan-binding protein [Deltaproteobacteria bacterium]|nr:peptidoglycan-binding protein [Deltaproteobacteria bacterium]